MRKLAFRFLHPLVMPAVIMFTMAMHVDGALGSYTIDRSYKLGDDPRENAVVGNRVNNKTPQAPFGKQDTIDGAGTVGAGQQVVNLQTSASGTFSVPTYVQVTDRPDFTVGQTGKAVRFVGTNFEHLKGARLGTPETTISSTEQGGSLNYEFILDRGMQYWTKPTLVPNTNSGLQADDDHIVMDTNNHGTLINSFGRFAMRYNSVDYAGVGAAAIAQPNQWYHVMMVRPDRNNADARMYVNGIAIAAAPGDYLRGIPPGLTIDHNPDTAPLVIGATTQPSATAFLTGFANNYSGIVDDVELFLYGLNGGTSGIGGTGDFGVFDFATDNWYAQKFGPANVLDLAGADGQITMADVNVFADNWLFEKVINGIRVGDLETVAKGDFNYDGIVDIADWEKLNAAHPTLGAAAMQLIAGVVPEPSALLLAVSSTVAALSTVRTKR